MENINKQPCTLFKEWADRMRENGIDSFVKDGVHYHHPDVDERYNVWNSTEPRVLFIAKEMRGDRPDIAEDWSVAKWEGINDYTRIQYLSTCNVCSEMK